MNKRLVNLKFNGIKFFVQPYGYSFRLTKDGKLITKLLLFHSSLWSIGWQSEQMGEYLFLGFFYLAWGMKKKEVKNV